MANTYTLIASNTLSSSAASVTFSSIPGTYTDLALRVSIRSTVADTFGILNFRINGNSSAIYSDTYIEGDGSSASSSRGSGNAEQYLRGMSADANQTSNTFASHEFYFPNYLSSANKVTSFFGVNETNDTSGRITASALLNRDTNAITSISLFRYSTGSFVSGSSFFLYGIKNS